MLLGSVLGSGRTANYTEPTPMQTLFKLTAKEVAAIRAPGAAVAAAVKSFRLRSGPSAAVTSTSGARVTMATAVAGRRSPFARRQPA